MNRKREHKGIPTGGQFATGSKDESDVNLGDAPDYVGADGAGVPLLVGDTLLRTGADRWTSTTWKVVGSKGDKVTVESDKTGKQMNISTEKYSVVRPDGGSEDRVGYTNWFTDREQAEQARDLWADRDPEYAQRIQDSIDDIPMVKVGAYRSRMEQLDPAVRMDVAESNFPLYFSLTGKQNRWSHDDALDAAKGHEEIPNREESEETYRSMDAADLRRHALTWGIRGRKTAIDTIKRIAAERGVDIEPHKKEQA